MNKEDPDVYDDAYFAMYDQYWPITRSGWKTDTSYVEECLNKNDYKNIDKKCGFVEK